MTVARVLFVVCCAVSTVSGTEFYSMDGVYGEMKGVKSASFICSYNMTSENLTIEWYRNGEPLHSNPNYTITNSTYGFSNLTKKSVGTDDFGSQYSCIFQPNGTKLELTLYAVPTVLIDHHGQKSKTLIEGNHLELNCTVYGWPLPSVTWSHEDNILDLTELQNVTSVGNVSLSLGLNVNNMNVTDRGNFVCNATNFFLNSTHVRSELILVRVKDNLLPLWPFLGIVCEVIVLAIIIGVYEFRRAKQKRLEQQKEANEHAALASKPSLGSSNVRQRK